MRLIDADALKEKKVYSHERHEKIVPVAEIDWSPTIDAIPVKWLEQQIAIAPGSLWATLLKDAINVWSKDQGRKMIAVDMEMPGTCQSCQLNNDYNRCVVTDNTTFNDIMRPRWCPLHKIEIKRDGTINISKD